MQTTISLRVNQEDATLFKQYAKFHGQTISDFVKSAVLEKIEDEYDIAVLRQAIAEDDGVRYTTQEVEKELGF